MPLSASRSGRDGTLLQQACYVEIVFAVARQLSQRHLWNVGTERRSFSSGPLLANAYVRIPAIALTTFVITYLALKLISLLPGNKYLIG